MMGIVVLVALTVGLVQCASVQVTPTQSLELEKSIIPDENGTYAIKEKCIDELGCFPIDGPWHHPTIRPINNFPDEREVVNVNFLLHTPRNVEKEDKLLWSSKPEQIKASNLNPSLKTIFLVHGFFDTQFFGKWMRLTKNELLKSDDYNVIIVDWQGGNGFPYTQATANTRVVAAEIALFINKAGLDPKKVHVVGHSLGSHIGGYVGKRIKIARITGLDPAEPYFQGMPVEVRLDRSDADFVDVIHTDGSPFLPNIGLGMIDPVGHVDFFPNGGKDHPGCDMVTRFLKIIKEGIVEGVRAIVICQHQRSIDFYMDSINTKIEPIAYSCKNFELFEAGNCIDCGSDGSRCAVMGHKAIEYAPFIKKTESKNFFIKTTDKSPFFPEHYSVKLLIPRSGKAATGHMYLTLNGDKGSVEFKVNENSRTFTPGATYQFLAVSGKDIGKVNRGSLSFKKSGWFGTSTVQVQEVNVFQMSKAVTTNGTKNQLTIKGCFRGAEIGSKPVPFASC